MASPASRRSKRSVERSGEHARAPRAQALHARTHVRALLPPRTLAFTLASRCLPTLTTRAPAYPNARARAPKHLSSYPAKSPDSPALLRLLRLGITFMT
ncbi:hypothetical protein CRG98_030604 [Punica granatum]|uniref:Uncharacterized protein n=1 Tax=Punica granatum TaxID=22663 RepID=A0A2I0IYC6_PUNGR|nr:hypothetical protein CRG98_030604 [Punica granatum]